MTTEPNVLDVADSVCQILVWDIDDGKGNTVLHLYDMDREKGEYKKMTSIMFSPGFTDMDLISIPGCPGDFCFYMLTKEEDSEEKQLYKLSMSLEESLVMKVPKGDKFLVADQNGLLFGANGSVLLGVDPKEESPVTTRNPNLFSKGITHIFTLGDNKLLVASLKAGSHAIMKIVHSKDLSLVGEVGQEEVRKAINWKEARTVGITKISGSRFCSSSWNLNVVWELKGLEIVPLQKFTYPVYEGRVTRNFLVPYSEKESGEGEYVFAYQILKWSGGKYSNFQKINLEEEFRFLSDNMIFDRGGIWKADLHGFRKVGEIESGNGVRALPASRKEKEFLRDKLSVAMATEGGSLPIPKEVIGVIGDFLAPNIVPESLKA